MSPRPTLRLAFPVMLALAAGCMAAPGNPAGTEGTTSGSSARKSPAPATASKAPASPAPTTSGAPATDAGPKPTGSAGTTAGSPTPSRAPGLVASPKPSIKPDTSGLIGITKFTVDTSRSPVRLAVEASHVDGKPLTYAWTATRGVLSASTGKEVTWTPPEAAGTSTITVVVSAPDGEAAEATVDL